MEYTIQLTFYLLHTLEPVQLGQNHRSDTAAHRWGGGGGGATRIEGAGRFDKEPSAGPALCGCRVGSQSCSD